MSKLMISVKEEKDDNVASASSIGLVEPDDGVDDDVDYEDEDEDEDEDFVEDEEVKDDDDVAISDLDPGDGRLFPNVYDDYRETIKWLIKIRAKIEPSGCRNKPPLKFINSSANVGETAVYANCGTLTSSGDMPVGQHLDLVSLLPPPCRLLRVGAASDHYIEPEALKGKYVLLVCVFAPTRWGEYNSKFLCQLRTISNQLSEAENFEMVIIPKMRNKCEGNEAAFDKLLSAFQGCLFVPFEYKDARDQICYHLNFRGCLQAILVDSDHKVAQNDLYEIVANYYYPSHTNNTKLKSLLPDWIRPPSPSHEWREKYLSSSLAWLLDSSYGDPTLRLHNLSSRETTTVGQLSDKLVGVYLFQVGDKLKSLRNVYRRCRKRGLDFHIVVVCISLFISVDPLEFHHVAVGELQRLIPNTPWWVLPYNVATCYNLYRLSLVVSEDAMITVGPSRKFFVDLHGGKVVHLYGIQAYPFNREMIVRKYELGAKAVTLDSLLSHGRVDYVLRGRKRVRVADLYDKVVVIYTDFWLQCDRNRYKCLSKWYKEIRKQHSDFEVVFVYYGKRDRSKDQMQSSNKIDLLARPFDRKHSEFFRGHKSFFMGDDGAGFPLEGLMPDSTLLFGKGGHLCSLDAVGHFEKYGLKGYPYERGCGDNYLRDEITVSLGLEYFFMRGYGYEKPYDVSLD